MSPPSWLVSVALVALPCCRSSEPPVLDDQPASFPTIANVTLGQLWSESGRGLPCRDYVHDDGVMTGILRAPGVPKDDPGFVLQCRVSDTITVLFRRDTLDQISVRAAPCDEGTSLDTCWRNRAGELSALLGQPDSVTVSVSGAANPADSAQSLTAVWRPGVGRPWFGM